MGMVKRNIHKSAIQHDIEYAYTEAGVEALLSDIHRFNHDESYGGDIDAVVLRLDLEAALQSRCLKSAQRQVIALYYFAGLTQEECQTILGVTQPAISARLSNAIVALSTHLSGELIEVSQTIGSHRPICLRQWIDNAARNEPNWWVVTNDVIRELRHVFGLPDADPVSDIDSTEEEYPWLTERQMSTRNREKEILRPEIHPVNIQSEVRQSKEDRHADRLRRRR